MEYIAKERAFHNGRMVNPGQPVEWPDDKDPPAWLARPDDAGAKGGKRAKADTRPDDAIAASKSKTAGLTGSGDA